MTSDKATLEAQLAFIMSDQASLKTAVAQRKDEITQIETRKAQLTEEILRNSGAIVYIDRMSQEISRKLDELAKTAALEADDSTPPPPPDVTE